ncbi:synaptophysin-like [Lethenteron reissneri]|uniref:synaptophysin-like n=1 Tax=Lethenteron reissneri TaxID=7753 RepID=UPI002AB6A553|nr:synaptophysin-like [Lethenteron reissneri]
MDAAQSASSFFGVVREPLGFIKLLEWIFSIFAFATCGGYSGYFEILVNCKNNSTNKTRIDFSYPFRLNQVTFPVPNCTANPKDVGNLYGDFSSSAEFFVTIAVFAFLYSLFALVVYTFYQPKYQQYRGPLIDFVITALFAFMWLVSSSAWAKGLADVKISTMPDTVYKLISICQEQKICTSGATAIMSSLNVSVVFGFLNLILWSGNVWFAYKETAWHGNAEPSSAATNPPKGPATGPATYGQ